MSKPSVGKDDDDKIIRSKFQMSMDNATMMEIYPYGGAMAYFKYHYSDGVAKQNLLLSDKTRYDYDHKKKTAVAGNPKTEGQTKKLTEKYGIGKVREEIGD